MDEDVLSGFPDFGDLDKELDGGPVPREGADDETGLDVDIRAFFTAFVKTARAAQLYVQGNPLLHQFIDDLHSRLQEIWSAIPSLTFTIHENEIRWLDNTVYKGKETAHDNIAFQLYKDGIRRVEFQPGVEEAELQQFLDVLRLGKSLKEDEDDLLTLIWNCDFQHIRYEYVDILGDEPPKAIQTITEDAGTELPMLPQLELSPELQTPKLREDFEPSLYFLDEQDVAHLQQELRREWERPIKHDVVSAVLDQYEVGEDERRGEVLDVLKQMLPRVLAEGDFAHAAYMVREIEAIAKKRQQQDIIEEVDNVVAELSQPIVVEQLVRVLEDGSIDPNSEDLATLLGVLRAEAVSTLMKAIPLVLQRDAKEQLMATLDRLAAANPKLMASMIGDDDPRVAAEAAKLAGRLKMAGTAEAIAGLLKRTEPEVRLAGVQALVELRTSVAGKPLLLALHDDQRDVRVAAARGLADLRYSPAAEELEGHITNKDLLKRDLTEQLAFFEAFARAAGNGGVKLLAKLLNGRRFLWLRHPSSLRACAARALGIIGGAEANRELNTAEMDRDTMVLSAVHKARTMPVEEIEAEMQDARA